MKASVFTMTSIILSYSDDDSDLYFGALNQVIVISSWQKIPTFHVHPSLQVGNRLYQSLPLVD